MITSFGVWWRSPATFAVIRSTTRQTRSEASGQSSLTGGRGSSMCMLRISRGVEPAKGSAPVSISYSTHPSEYMSDRMSMSFFPRACSGEA